MSEPIREQLAKVIFLELAGFEYSPHYGQSREWSTAGDLADAILSRWSLSPVGETEAAKLPLDPEPWALLVNTDIRYSSNLLIASAQRVIFTPRPGYSQDLADYSDVAPRLELDPRPWIEDSNGVGAHHSWTVNCDGYGCKFAPRPGYSQIEGDYR